MKTLISFLIILSFLMQSIEASCLSCIESKDTLRPVASAVAIENRGTGQKVLNAPHRLTIDECRQRLLEGLRGLRGLYPVLQKEFASGLEILKKEGVDAFEKKAYPRIKEVSDRMKVKVSTIKTLPAVFAFSEPEIREKLDIFLSQIADAAKVDKVLIRFVDNLEYNFTYTHGFSKQDLTAFHYNRSDIHTAITDERELSGKKDEKTRKQEKILLRECGITSAIWVTTDIEKRRYNKDNYITIIIGRSEEYVKTYGELTGEDRILLTDRLDTFIDTRTAPWWGIRDYLKINHYYDFDIFMMILRHNGIILPFIYIDFQYYIDKVRANDGESHEQLDVLIREVERFAKKTSTIERMDTFLQILENGTDFRPRNITQYIHNRVELFRQETMAKRLTFVSDLSNEDLVVSCCDLNLIGVLVDNLIQNAIKYTDSGSIIVRLFRETEKDVYGSQVEQKCAVFEIEDTGMGIPKDDRYKIFRRGFRADNVGEIQGTGIGLDVVSSIVYLMKGYIDVESELDKGTKITISIPLAAHEEILDSSVSVNVNSPFVVAPIKEYKTSLAILQAA